MEEQIIPIFCDVDDFCTEYEKYCQTYLLTDESHMIPHSKMSVSEIMTIIICFHLSNHRTFKWYYIRLICGQMRCYFPRLVSYNRFVELMQSVVAPLTLYLMKHRLGKCSGISFLDSTSLDVCNTRRISSHKVFENIAQRGKSSTGWFFGFKLHIAINDKGEIIAFCLTPANVDDRDWSVISKLTAEMFGKVFADKGYISAPLFEKLWDNGVQLILLLDKSLKSSRY